MFQGLKILNDVPGRRNVLVEIILIFCLFQFRPSYTERIGNRTVKRDVSNMDIESIRATWLKFSQHEYRFVIIFREEFVSAHIACHGLLVAPHIVLTVPEPQCRKLEAGKAMAIAGMHNIRINEVTQQSRSVCHVEIHPKASKTTNAYMIMYLSDPFILNDYVSTISMPYTNTANPQECMFPAWYKEEGLQEPTHAPVKIHQCNIDPSVICTGAGPCVDWGSPLVCSEGNREFAAGMLVNAEPCSGSQEAYFASFMYTGFKDWFKESVQKIPKQCYETHG